MKLQDKLVVAAVLTGVLPVILTAYAIGMTSADLSRDALERQVQAQLVSVRDTQRERVADYFRTLRAQIQTFSHNRMIVNAVEGFEAVMPEITRRGNKDAALGEVVSTYYKRHANAPDDGLNFSEQLDATAIALQHDYIATNPHSAAARSFLEEGPRGGRYDVLHATYHPHLRDFLGQFGYDDIYLIEAKSGRVVYSVGKGADFGTSLIHGPFAASVLGQVVGKILQQPVEDADDHVIFTDLAPYAAADDRWTAFTASAVVAHGDIIGVLVFRISGDPINKLMTFGGRWQAAGLGATGESYLVGPDGTMRSDSRMRQESPHAFFKHAAEVGVSAELLARVRARDSTVGLQPASGPAVNAGLAGKRGTTTQRSYLGTQVLTGYAPLNVEGLHWVVVSEIAVDEALAPVATIVAKIGRWTALILLAVVLITAFGSWLLARHSGRRIADRLVVIQRFSQGDMSARMDPAGTDEIAIFSAFYNRFADNLSDAMRQVRIAAEQVATSAQEIARGSTELADRSQAQMHLIEGMDGQVHAVSDSVHGAAVHGNQARKLAENAARRTADTRAMTTRAVSAMERIHARAEETSGIAGLIRDISAQTNLVALNAAIESAEAGDYGKRFSVVATEVRSLAERAGEAAGNVADLVEGSSTRIKTGHALVGEAANALLQITQAVDTVNQLVSEIATGAAGQVERMSGVTQAMAEVRSETEKNELLVQSSVDTAKRLSQEAARLRSLVAGFHLGKPAGEGDALHGAS